MGYYNNHIHVTYIFPKSTLYSVNIKYTHTVSLIRNIYFQIFTILLSPFVSRIHQWSQRKMFCQSNVNQLFFCVISLLLGILTKTTKWVTSKENTKKT